MFWHAACLTELLLPGNALVGRSAGNRTSRNEARHPPRDPFNAMEIPNDRPRLAGQPVRLLGKILLPPVCLGFGHALRLPHYFSNTDQRELSMKTPRKIRCVVIAVPAGNQPSRSRIRPSQMLPWNDPTIAKLVTKLQNEIRGSQEITAKSERCTALQNFRQDDISRCELEVPWNDAFEYEGGNDGEDLSLDFSRLSQF